MAKRKQTTAPESKSDTLMESPGGTVPGPSPDPASNLIMADIAIRAGTYILRDVVEKSMLKGRYSPNVAKKILNNRSKGQNLAAFAAAKVATRSVPGAAVVGSGILLKALFDLSQKRRARLRGRKALAEQALDTE